MIQVIKQIPYIINDEHNNDIKEPITTEELNLAIKSMQPDKSIGLDGWSIEFYSSMYEYIGGDILSMVEECRKKGTILAAFNTIFLTLIPKVDHFTRMEQLRPIFLCNFIYKLITHIIAR